MQNPTMIVITGPMCAGKTRDAISRHDTLRRKKQKVMFFRHTLDDRPFQSRGTPTRIETIPVTTGAQIVEAVLRKDKDFDPDSLSQDSNLFRIADVVMIDEIQFFEDPQELLKACQTLLKARCSILAFGLDLWAESTPAASTSLLASFADQVIKLAAVCPHCGENATMTQRLGPGGVGDLQYEPRCRSCHYVA